MRGQSTFSTRALYMSLDALQSPTHTSNPQLCPNVFLSQDLERKQTMKEKHFQSSRQSRRRGERLDTHSTAHHHRGAFALLHHTMSRSDSIS